MEQTQVVMPGDKLGVEEEYIASDNTYVEESDGTIRAAIVGVPTIKDGKIAVNNPKHDIIPIKRGMYVVGTVSDDVKGILFLKLDKVEVDGREYLPLKDGKIVSLPPRGGMGRGPPRSEGGRPEPRQKPQKPAGVGDVVLAKVLYVDPEIYTLDLGDPNSGVIHSLCEMCSTHMISKGGVLVCEACEHRQSKKISPLYDKSDAVKKLFA